MGRRLRGAVSGAFRRTSSALSITLVVSFSVMLLSMVYNAAVLSPSQFLQLPEVQFYENRVTTVSEMDNWARTQFYWSNNLQVGLTYAAGVPAYLGFNNMVANNWMLGTSLVYWHYLSTTYIGVSVAPAFLAEVFVHGLLELTGFFIIAAVALRLGWNTWKALGRLIAVDITRETMFSLRLSARQRREFRKHKAAAKLLVTDFIVLFAVGMFLIFLGAPVEAYISPGTAALFFGSQVLTVLFLTAVMFTYLAIAVWGLSAMRRDLKKVWGETGKILMGKWSPVQLSFLMFTVLFVVTLITIVS